MAQLAAFWAKLTILVSTMRFSDIVDILIVAYLIYNIIMLIRKTNSFRLARGILLILIALWLSGVLKLTMFNRLLQKTVELGLIALVIIFQPELRRTLERMGQSTMWANLLVGNRRSWVWITSSRRRSPRARSCRRPRPAHSLFLSAV